MKKHVPPKLSSPVIDIYDPYAPPGRSLPRTPRSAGRKKGKKFTFVSTRIGIRRSSTRRRHRSSSRRRNSLSKRSSGIYGIDASIANPEAPSDNRRGYPDVESGNAFSHAKDGLPTFLQRKIPPSMRKAKTSKLSQGKENRPMDMTSLMAQGSNLRNTEVELPFFMPSIESPDVIDLSSCATEFQGATVRPLHHSILGRDHCFEVITSNGARCFGCDSAGEREAWIEKIKRAINPNLDNSRRIEHQLLLFVQEMKGLPTKKKYFCEICLDRKLCARTTSKWKNDNSIFWGEHFEFSSMPDIQDVTVHLYKDSDKKKKKDKDYIGLVNLPASTLVNQQTVEKWYTLSTPSGNNKSKTGESMALRIKAKFLSTRVLPTDQYKAFAEHISNNYLNICRTLSNVISVSKKDEIAKILVNVMHGTGSVKNYMTDLIMDEVEKVEEESLIFRENTIGTKSVEAMLRLVGMKYLYDTLGDFILALFNMEEECEVDGSRLPPHASLETNQKNLHMSCEIALCKIVTSVNTFPSELREVMASWRMKCEAAGRPRIANRLVTASLFLRLLCPAILNPSLFGLANEVPDAKVCRTLTLIAKVIQNLANRSRFGIKEEYMQFMDVFVRKKWDDMGTFIANVSDPSVPPIHKGFKGFIDLGKEFAKLHAFFVETLPTLDQKTISELGDLPSIVNEVTEALEKPAASYTPSIHSQVTAQTHISHLAEDVSLSHESDPLVLRDCDSSPVIEGRSFLSGGGATSMLDLRDLMNVNEDSGRTEIGCSFNNSNNTGASNRQTLTSTENLIPVSSGSKQPPLPERPPLMFSNPAYQLPKHRNLAAKASYPASEASARSLQEAKNPAPLSFANPLQAMHPPHQHHLETVFTTETVTYSAPSRYLGASNPAASSQSSDVFSGLRCEPSSHNSVFRSNSRISDCSQSNDSSLSSRQSSTTTANSSDVTDSSPNPSRFKPNEPKKSVATRSKNPQLFDPRNEPLDEDKLLMSVESTSTSVSNAHRKTGLQLSSQHQKPTDNQPYKPQPKPRSSVAHFAHIPSETSVGRKTSVPNISSTRKPNLSTRRGSCDNSRSANTEETTKYPSFFLSKLDQEIVLELNEGTDAEVTDNRHKRRKDNSSQFTKDQDGFVTVPGAAVKSRVVVPTFNANRVKTSKHVPPSGQQKGHPNAPQAQPLRRSSYQKSSPVTSKPAPPPSGACAALPPTTPESELSPEARTAQWILNSVSAPNKELKHENDIGVVLTPKDYEDRIIGLESEVERLRGLLSEGAGAQHTHERKEAILLEKIRNLERKESKSRRKNEEKDQQMQKVTQRLNALETLHRKERDEQLRERNQLQAIIKGKESAMAEQQKVIRRLESRLSRSEHHMRPVSDTSGRSGEFRGKSNLESSLSFIDDADESEPLPRQPNRSQEKRSVANINGQVRVNGDSSSSSSSSI